MSFLINLGDKFKIDSSLSPDGSLILAGSITMHTLLRRTFNYQHLNNRFFDPQLYLTGLDPNQTERYCARLASYPWFGVNELHEYDSKEQKQKGWMEDAVKKISKLWLRNPINIDRDPQLVREVVGECIDFQDQIGCAAIILPSPLTLDMSTDYSVELSWLDMGIDYAKRIKNIEKPIYATVALSDVCLRYLDPMDNQLLSIILDSIGAREVDGVYIVVEQSSEPNSTRQIGNTRVLWSSLYMTHVFKHDVGIKVGVNFFGMFGLALEAAGADFWASGWYKSQYRLRIADKLGGGPAFPLCWSTKTLLDINLETDFDILQRAGLIDSIVERTTASSGLLTAANRGVSVNQVPAWRYNPSNITAAKNHFIECAVEAENEQKQYHGVDRLNFVGNTWFASAVSLSQNIRSILGANAKTTTDHIQAWVDAFSFFRRDQNL